MPGGKEDLQEPCAVIPDAVPNENHVALDRVVMTGRERIVAIEGRHQYLLLTMPRSADEVRDEATAFAGLENMHVDPAMIDIARAIITKQSGAFEPANFCDHYAGPSMH